MKIIIANADVATIIPILYIDPFVISESPIIVFNLKDNPPRIIKVNNTAICDTILFSCLILALVINVSSIVIPLGATLLDRRDYLAGGVASSILFVVDQRD